MMNRKKFLHSLAAFFFAALFTCSVPAFADDAPAAAPENGKRVLVACFSWTGNTRALAEKICALTGGEFFEVVPETPYPREYSKCTEQAKKEIAEGFRPALKSKPENIGSYDVIFIGSPNWWGTYAPPISTLLDDPAFAGKTVVPFFTHGGSGMRNCESDMRKQLADSNVLKALTVSGKSVESDKTDREVKAWLKEIGVAE